MAKPFVTPFALSGDKTPVPDAAQPDGSVSYTQGFGPDYQQEQGTPGAKDIPRDQFNQLVYDITEAIGQMQRQGFADYHPSMAPYPQGAVVRSGSTNYISGVDNNSTVPGAVGADWAVLGGDTTPVGTTIMYNADTAPPGYLVENGAAVSRTQYAALFSVIGTRYGAGNGTTTFNLPGSGGHFPRFAHAGQTIDTGRVVGSKQLQSIQSHDHRNGVADDRHADGPSCFVYAPTSTDMPGLATRGVANANESQTQYQGMTSATGDTETRPRNIAKLPCIKF